MLISVMGFTAGEGDTDFELEGVEIELGDVRTSDIAWPLRHGSRPGVDFLEAGSITFSLVSSYGINDPEEADEAVNKFMGAWRSGLHAAPGEMVPLVIDTGHKSRVVYGRPRRVAQPVPGNNYLEAGIAEVTAAFSILDPLAYSQVPVVVPMSVIPKSLGGIVTPLVTPVTTTMSSGIEYRMLKVGGVAPAPLRVTFHGPAKDPKLEVGGVELGIKGTLLYDEEIIVDGRNRTVVYGDGRQASKKLTRNSRIDKLSVEPGNHNIGFTATDRTGTAQVTVEATPAYYHI